MLILRIIVGIALAACTIGTQTSHARDLDGHYAQDNPELHSWFNGLASGKGLCCSLADGVRIDDVDWDSSCVPDIASPSSLTCTYRVRIKGEWIVVPDEAVITEPNKAGFAVVWPYTDISPTQIRCFIPGAGS